MEKWLKKKKEKVFPWLMFNPVKSGASLVWTERGTEDVVWIPYYCGVRKGGEEYVAFIPLCPLTVQNSCIGVGVFS